MLLTEERMCRIGEVLDHRQYSALKKINNWRLLMYTLKKSVLNQGRQQLVFNKSFFISDNCFTSIYPGKIPTCGSQTHMQLQKLRCIFDCIIHIPQNSHTSLNLHFSLQSSIPEGSSFLSVHVELMSETMALFSIPDASTA